jgi:bacillithiol system protein YtxJ
MKSLTSLHDIAQVEAAIAESRERPVLLFKHSRYCGVSCEALDELQSHIDAQADPGITYKLVTVQTDRPVSDAIAQRLGLRHETPQAILIKDGKIVWNASHFRITATKLDEVVSGHRPSPLP